MSNSVGPLIKHLRVAQISFWPAGKELEFFNGMKNLTSFEAGFFGPGRQPDVQELSLEDRLLPKTFKSLESIKIGQDNEFVKTVDIVTRSCDVLITSPQLKYAKLPFDSTFKAPEYGHGLTELTLIHSARGFTDLLIYINERPNELFLSDVQGHLEYYDFENYHHENIPWTLETSQESSSRLPFIWYGSKMFLPICERALKTGVKLLNVNPIWYCARFNLDPRMASPELGIPVVSLVGIDPCMMELDMPNLEKITIPRTSSCVTGATGAGSRPLWPALKSVDITVDGKDGNVWEVARKARFTDIKRVIGEITYLSFKFLFGYGVVRTNMAELSIKFVEGKGRREVAVPKVEDIVASCPNLKRIKLGNWMGTNKQLVELWKGLPGLEEVSMENCKELGNVAFVGENVEIPVFLGLENLKKLSLKGLDKMPKITDTLFCLVLAKMNLDELVLTSDEPVEKVTKKGITALLEGPFAQTIGRFPFRDWSLADMTAEEFQKMEKKFRSYDMI